MRYRNTALKWLLAGVKSTDPKQTDQNALKKRSLLYAFLYGKMHDKMVTEIQRILLL